MQRNTSANAGLTFLEAECLAAPRTRCCVALMYSRTPESYCSPARAAGPQLMALASIPQRLHRASGYPDIYALKLYFRGSARRIMPFNTSHSDPRTRIRRPTRRKSCFGKNPLLNYSFTSHISIGSIPI